MLLFYPHGCLSSNSNCSCTSLQKFRSAVKPSKHWEPSDDDAKIGYHDQEESQQNMSLLKRMKFNTFGNKI